MLLRRVVAHVRRQDWTAIGIDFVIVVVGVFIGIQVSNWNDERLREQTARTYIERIREDLSANLFDLGERLAYFRQVRANALAALSALDGPGDALGEQFLIDAYQASQMLPRRFGRDTYDEILSVGANSAIADVTVRNRLANFYRSIEAQMVLLAPICLTPFSQRFVPPAMTSPRPAKPGSRSFRFPPAAIPTWPPQRSRRPSRPYAS